MHILKPRSHIACNRSVTSLRPKFWVVTGRLQGGCTEVGDWSATGCRRLQGRFGRKEVLVAASKTSLGPNRSYKVFGGRQQVADWLATDRRPISVVVDNPKTVFSRRLIADQLPTDLKNVADFLQSKTNAQDTVANQSPTDHQSVADRSPTDRRLIADWSATNVWWHCLYSINNKSLSAPEPMLDLFSVSYSDINLNAISWWQFYRRYLNCQSLKLTWKLLIWYFFLFFRPQWV